MKKYLLLAAIAATAFTACTSDEAVELNPGEAINFRTAAGASTKSIIEVKTDKTNLDNIWVYAEHNSRAYFSPNYINLTKDGGYVNVANTSYWPTDDSSVDFYAMNVVNGSTDTGIGTGNSINRSDKNVAAVTIANADEMYDLMYAFKSGKKSTHSSGVELNFKHTLSKITVKAKNDNTTLKFTVAGYKIFNLNSTGTFTGTAVDNADATATTAMWTAQANRVKYDVYNTGGLVTLDGVTVATEIGEPIIVIPQEVANSNTATTTAYATDNTTVFIGVLCQIQNTADDSVLFPTSTERAAGKTYDADGSVNASTGAYAYICTVIPDRTFAGQTNTTLTLDVTKGGYRESNIANQPVFEDGSAITFTTAVTDWTPDTQDITL